MIGVSQSGGSTDLVEVMRAAAFVRRADARGHQRSVSPLAQAAELHIDVAAGHERAVAATKTYTAELLALLLLIEGVRGGRRRAQRRAVRAGCAAGPCRRLLDDPTPAELAGRYRFAARVVTTGRGYAYPTAREAALKLMETSYLPALAFSGADLLHGPLAMTDTGCARPRRGR